MANVVVMGAAGRMGQMLCGAVRKRDDLTLTGAIEHSEHPWIGQDLGTARGEAPWGVTVASDPAAAIAGAQVILDFTAPALTVKTAALAAEHGVVHVIGTTGLTPEEDAALDAAAEKTVIIQAGNMSLGVNLMTTLTRMVAQALDADFDIEVVEAHHNQKVDAPSGTALMLGQAAADGRGIDLTGNKESGRDGITGARAKGSIGFSAIRGGDIVGEHDVIFAGPGERIVLRHVASDRSIFANGATKAGLWGLLQPPGRYNMKDVLGLKD